MIPPLSEIPVILKMFQWIVMSHDFQKMHMINLWTLAGISANISSDITTAIIMNPEIWYFKSLTEVSKSN